MQFTRSLRVRPLDVFHTEYCSLYLLANVDDDEIYLQGLVDKVQHRWR